MCLKVFVELIEADGKQALFGHHADSLKRYYLK